MTKEVMKNIQMNAEMAKAILDGRKVQTRRVIAKFDILNIDVDWQTIEFNDKKIIEKGEDGEWGEMDMIDFISTCSKYQKGEVAWVREPARAYYCHRDYMKIRCEYLADKETIQLRIPSRFCKQTKDGWLPNWMRRKKGIPNGCIKEMARIFLKITDVRVERLQDIFESQEDTADVFKEGFGEIGELSTWQKAMVDFKNIWNKTAQKGYKWEDNPYVFVYEFERVDQDGSEL